MAGLAPNASWEMPAAPRPVAGLSAALLPVREFPRRRWFCASTRWYYHGPRRGQAVRETPRFFARIDPDLRPLCRLARAAGLGTTPSCQGHFHDRVHFAAAWDTLGRQADRVRGPGLLVRDAETDELCRFRDPGHALPWPGFAAFHAAAGAAQHQGYLGLLVPAERGGLVRRLSADAYRTAYAVLAPEGGAGNGPPEEGPSRRLFALTVAAPTPDGQAAEWQALTRYVAAVLRGGT